MGKFGIIDIFSKKKSKNPTPLTVDPIYFHIIFFAGIDFSWSLYPVAKIIENSKFWAYAVHNKEKSPLIIISYSLQFSSATYFIILNRLKYYLMPPKLFLAQLRNGSQSELSFEPNLLRKVRQRPEVNFEFKTLD